MSHQPAELAKVDNMNVTLLTFSCLKNISRDSITEIAWIVDNPEESGFAHPAYVSSAIVLLILLTGVPWNLFIIVTIVRKELYDTVADLEGFPRFPLKPPFN